VKIEGSFILRYRVFDIFSKAYGENDLVIQAECYGGPFRIYSTKEFPGLQASTDLTKASANIFTSFTCYFNTYAARLSNLPDGAFVSIFVKQNEDVGRKANEVRQVPFPVHPEGRENRSLALTVVGKIPKVTAIENLPRP
jgi:hypothetical protein